MPKNQIQLHKDFLLEQGLPYDSNDVVLDKIIDTTRWSEIHELIFVHEGKFWRTSYSQGLTEMQDESPWEHVTLVTCTEVQLVEKIVKVWQEVEVPETLDSLGFSFESGV